MNYVPFLSSSDAAAAAGENKVTAVFLPLGELAGELEAGRLRLVATAGAERNPGRETPTLAEGGLPFEWANWRGVVARPGLPAAEQAKLGKILAGILDTASWRAMIAARHWRSAYLPPEEFGPFLKRERARLKTALKAAGLIKGPE
jgi:putative tricarboxylic transport membrane protein